MAKRKVREILTIALALVILFGAVNFDVYAATDSNNTEEVDKLKPVIDYAYVEDGKLILSISDNDELDSKPIIYKIDKELHSYEIDEDDYEYEYDGRKRVGKVYEIEVEIPSSISIIIRDYAGNENTYKFSIKEDYVPLTKYIPEFVLDRLAEGKQSKVDRFKGYEDIFELEYGKVVDALSLYDKVIKNKYNSFNRNDIKFKVKGLSSDKSGNIKLDKFGIFEVTITHSKDKTFEKSAYILIKPDWKNTDEGRVLSSMNPYIVYKDKIKVADYFKYEDEASNNKGKGKIDTTYLLVYNEETGETVGMTDQISLELNKTYKLSVLNFENNSEQDFYIMRQEKAKSINKNFMDIDKDYWASSDINALVTKGLLSGYPDGTFNPKGNITVKEFMTILSRQIATIPDKAKPVAGNVTVPIGSGSWGYIESKSVLDRLVTEDLFKFNYLNLDRPINREEVAFLIDNTLEIGTAYATNVNKPLKDVATSAYYSEISKLIDLGLISGYPDGTFRPKNNITRAEIAAIFTRIK
jgi:hypothetical protein